MPNEIRIPSPSFAPLRSRLKGSVMDDPFTCGRYATDASIYQMMPHAVVVPETLADVEATMDFAREQGASVIVRGLRAVSDFEIEFQMASINKRLHGDLETVFLMAAEQQHFVASRFVKEVSRFGGDISSFVPASVLRKMRDVNAG